MASKIAVIATALRCLWEKLKSQPQISQKQEVSQIHVSGQAVIKQQQAGQNIIETGNINISQIYESANKIGLTAPGEQLIYFENDEQLAKKTEKLWNKAKQFIKMSSLYGKPFLPPEESIRQLLYNNNYLKVHLLLIDADSPVAEDIASLKASFNPRRSFADVVDDDIIKPTISPQKILYLMRSSVDSTIDLMRKLKSEFPTTDIRVRKFRDALPTWKGTIIDMQDALYVIYDAPRTDIPFRTSNNRQLLEWYHKRYFSSLWNISPEVVP